ncbi:hypothetical protein JHD47_00410 [Sulfurimonas sp. SAG-AH-194-L11]|nr:hypothetical protein [Sulfurimonas sp. SAG-AH-194-L11]MDF1876276.1 hypothetical protein [Sulfurimonas sp. SAG-AH-194-L11]
MEVVLLVKSFLGLVAILGILIFFLLYIPKKKKKKKAPKPSPTKERYGSDYKTLKELLQIIKNKQSTAQELASALDLVMKYHGNIHPKLGIRTHPDFDIYAEILLRICRHPNTNKDIILKFNRELEKRNEAYKREINDFITKGLESRGF